jgi:hypothetical protein
MYAEQRKGVWVGLFHALAQAGGHPAQILIDCSATSLFNPASRGAYCCASHSAISASLTLPAIPVFDRRIALVKVGRLYKRLRWQGAARFINDELPCNLVHREPPIPESAKDSARYQEFPLHHAVMASCKVLIVVEKWRAL